MAKPHNRKPPGPPVNPPQQALLKQAMHVVQHQGPLPAPDDLDRYNTLLPGAAERIIRMAEEESAHRRAIEDRTNRVNCDANAKQVETIGYQTRAVFKSDVIGQVAGLIVALTCIASAVYLSINGHEWIAGALAAIPTAAVIQAFLVKRSSSAGNQSGQ